MPYGGNTIAADREVDQPFGFISATVESKSYTVDTQGDGRLEGDLKVKIQAEGRTCKTNPNSIQFHLIDDRIFLSLQKTSSGGPGPIVACNASSNPISWRYS